MKLTPKKEVDSPEGVKWIPIVLVAIVGMIILCLIGWQPPLYWEGRLNPDIEKSKQSIILTNAPVTAGPYLTIIVYTATSTLTRTPPARKTDEPLTTTP